MSRPTLQVHASTGVGAAPAPRTGGAQASGTGSSPVVPRPCIGRRRGGCTVFAYIVRRLIVRLHHADRDEPRDVPALLRLADRPGAATPAARTARRHCSEQTKKALGYDKPAHRAVGRLPPGHRRRPASTPTTRRCAKAAPGASPTARPRAWATRGTTTRPSTNLIKDAFPVSLSLALVAFIMWIAGGVAVRGDRRLEKGHDHRPRDRRALAGLLRVPDLLHRAVPLQVRRDQVAGGRRSRVHPHRGRRRRHLARPACSCPA